MKSLEEPIDHKDQSLSCLPEEGKLKFKKKTNMKSQKHPIEYEEQTICKASNEELKSIIEPLVEEMKLLRETVHHDIIDLQNAVSQQKQDITKLEESLTGSQKEIRNFLIYKIELNTRNIKLVMEENKLLKKENDQLKDRICQIKKSQLENNVMISGQPEHP